MSDEQSGPVEWQRVVAAEAKEVPAENYYCE